MADDVELEIGSVRFTDWEALTISRALDTCADAFSFSSAFNPERADLRAAFKPFGYQPATIKIDGELILTGQIESVAPSLVESDRPINIQGRSLTGPLIDCAIDEVGYEFSGLSLRKIAEKVAARFGVKVVTSEAILAAADKAIGEARAEPGALAFDFLSGLAASMGVLLTNDAPGRLVITSPNPNAAPVAALVEGLSEMRSISANYDGTKRFSEYKVLLQQDGNEAITGIANDPKIMVYRPRIYTSGQGPATGAKSSAEWARALALAESVQVDISLSGWRGPSKALWAPGQIVTIKAPSVFIDTEMPFMIAGVDFALDGGGRTSALRLVLPSTYTGKTPEAYPWD